jgi:diacylglycerol kinase (ATP)
VSPAPDAARDSKVAVVAHARKSLGGGLGELRELLAAEGVTDPIWYEVNKSRKAPKRARRALSEGAGLIFVWGGDGMVQHCVDALAGTDAVLAVLPAGTANLLATNLGIPERLTEAVRIGLHGGRRRLDTGMVNGEHFAVMAGAGLDARMISGAKRKLKNRLGRAAYLYTGARSLGASPATAEVEVDGRPFFTGQASLVLVGNVGRVLGGIRAFSAAEPDDGLLDLGVVTAANPVEWVRALGQVALGEAGESPFVQLTRGKQFEIKFDREQPYELDGGARHAVRELSIEVCPASISVCVPERPARRAAGGGG